MLFLHPHPVIQIGIALACTVLLPDPVALAEQSFANGVPNEFAWTKPDKDNCMVTQDVEYNRKIKALSVAVLGKSDAPLGCVTEPYLETPYDVNGDLGIWNDVHAGIDLKANGASVFALEDGTVVGVNLCVKGDIPYKQQKKCITPDGREHSTLIVENKAKTYKFLYVHMKEIAVALGASVQKGDLVGKSGSVGTTNPHLHLEIWSATAPQYCNPPRIGGVSGSFCPNKAPRKTGAKKERDQKAYCESEDIVRMTVDPVKVADAISKAGPWKKTNLTSDSPVTIYGIGQVRAGMTLGQAQAAIGGDLDYEHDANCFYALPRQGPGGVSFMVSGDNKIRRVDIHSCQIRTDKGAKIGDTETRIQGLYSSIKSDAHHYVEEGHYMFLQPAATRDKKYLLLFETDGKRVTTFRSGFAADVGLVEGCF